MKLLSRDQLKNWMDRKNREESQEKKAEADSSAYGYAEPPKLETSGEPIYRLESKTTLGDWVRQYDEFVPDSFCDEMIAFCDNPATPKGAHTQTWRRCQEVSCIDQSPLWPAFKSYMINAYTRYRMELDSGTLAFVNYIEAPNIFKYDPDPERPNIFHNHSDSWNYGTASRQLSIIVYLNDVAEGGGTSFEYIGTTVTPKKGRVLIFPSSFVYTHRGEAPISNTKYIVVSWLHFDNPTHHYRTQRLT